MSVSRARSLTDRFPDDRSADRPDGPAEAYWRTGALVELSARLDRSLGELSGWWAEQDQRGALVAEQGPFAGEPGAAVAVSVDSLAAARRACDDLHAALERAQMASADLEPASTPRADDRRHLFRRR